MADIFSNSVVESVRKNGFTDKGMLIVIKDISSLSFIRGAEASFEIISEMTMEYARNIKTDNDYGTEDRRNI